MSLDREDESCRKMFMFFLNLLTQIIDKMEKSVL